MTRVLTPTTYGLPPILNTISSTVNSYQQTDKTPTTTRYHWHWASKDTEYWYHPILIHNLKYHIIKQIAWTEWPT